MVYPFRVYLPEIALALERSLERVEDGMPGLEMNSGFTWLMLSKPLATVCSRRDPLGRRLVYDCLPADLPKLEAIGRLDRDSTGLLLFTNQHALGQALLHPKNLIPREYHIVTNKPLPEFAGRELAAGLLLKDGLHCQPVRLQTMPAPEPDCSYALTVTEGKHREIRRIAMHYGRRVIRLQRVRFGPLVLGDLPPGAWRFLTNCEIESLAKLIG